ncbi:MAG: hypothetical protein R3F43_31085 [bacterium]
MCAAAASPPSASPPSTRPPTPCAPASSGSRTLPQALWADGPDGRRFVARYGATRPFASVPEALAGISAVAEGLRGRLPTP